jgi:hypothetical protein
MAKGENIIMTGTVKDIFERDPSKQFLIGGSGVSDLPLAPDRKQCSEKNPPQRFGTISIHPSYQEWQTTWRGLLFCILVKALWLNQNREAM